MLTPVSPRALSLNSLSWEVLGGKLQVGVYDIKTRYNTAEPVAICKNGRMEDSSLTTLKGLRDKADNGKYSCSST